MASQNVRMHGPAQVSNVAAVKYTAPAGKITTLQHVHVQNPGSDGLTFSMSIGVDGAKTRVYDGVTIGAGQVLDVFCKFVLNAGEVIQAVASANNVLTLTLDGTESVPVLAIGGAQLQNPVAPTVLQWELNGVDDATVLVDRSGNNKPLTFISSNATTRLWIPDLRPGYFCYCRQNDGVGGLERASDAATCLINSPLTVLCRAFISDYNTPRDIVSSQIVAGGYHWRVGVDFIGGTRRLLVGSNNINAASVTTTIPKGWHVFSFRRDATGLIWRVAIDDLVPEVVSPSSYVPGSVGGKIIIGDGQGFGGGGFPGGLSDIGLYSVQLSDAEIITQYKRMMGIA